MTLTGYDVAHLMLLLGVLLLAARGMGEIFRQMKQPAIIGEIIAGIFLGPSILGNLFPQVHAFFFKSSPAAMLAIQGITQFALVLLLLISGIEVDLARAIKQGKSALLTSLFSFLFPFAIGYGAGYFFATQLGLQQGGNPVVFALFLGVALSITALPVVARTLMDIGIFNSEVGLTIIASSMFIDFIGWLIFSVILSMLGQSMTPYGFTGTVLLTFAFVGFTLLIGRKIINKMIPFIQEKLSFPGGILNFIFILGLFAAAFTEYIGIHAIFGAFIMGIAIGDSPHLKEQTRENIQQFITNIFAPLFFISIGLRADFVNNFNGWLLLIYLLLAFGTKIIGSSFGAFLGGFKKYDAFIVGFGMNSRGAMEIILGLLALQFHVINEQVYVVLVLMALITSLSSAPLMSIFIRKSPSFIKPSKLLKPKQVIISKARSVEEVIKELTQVAADVLRMKPETIYKDVMQRESELPTGIARAVAIPHARVAIANPFIGAAYVSAGIDFSAADEIPANIVFLLLTPVKKNELQLEMLAGLARFASVVNVAEFAAQTDEKALHQKLIAILETVERK